MGMLEIFNYGFMQRAVIVGVLVSLCSALLGVSLVLKRFSMIGDGLSHVGFGALAIATVCSVSPLLFTIPVVTVSSILLLRMNEKSLLSSESGVALLSSSALALGVFALSVTGGNNTDLNSFLFGSLLSVSKEDAIFSVILSLSVMLFYVLLYPRIYAVTFDPVFARSSGVKVDFHNTVLAILSSLTVVLGMRMLGSLLISALIIFPPLSAMRIFKRYKSTVLFSAAISVVSFMAGVYVSYYLSAPIGSSVVLVNLLVFIVCSAIKAIRERTD